MADFPILKSGAVAQDGAALRTEFSTHALRFADGAYQRFRQRRGALRQWVIRLELLTDEEAAELGAFLDARQGRHGSFSFFDPWDEVEYPNCSLAEDAHVLDYREHLRTAGVIRVRQNWS